MKKCLIRINIIFLLFIFLGNGVKIFAKDNPNNVNFLKVGDSDCILIKSNIENILIDLGEKKYENNILDYLKEEGIEELDAIILTNFKNNRIGALDIILENFKINKIFLPNYCDNKENKDLIIKNLKEKNISYDFIKKGWSYNKGNIYIEAKLPLENIFNNNYNSVVLYGV
ncbi:hypothetical protein GBZ86_14355, partial [Clostridium tarantellae]|nr:hypothetical protein [Clostridium tarantellae]